MATPFSKIYNKFLGFIDDTYFASLTDEELKEVLFDYLDTAKAIYFKNCTKDLDSVDLINEEFHSDLTSEEIVILAYGILLVWIEPKIHTLRLLKKRIGTKDFKETSSASHLTSLVNYRKEVEKQLEKYKASYDYTDFTGF